MSGLSPVSFAKGRAHEPRLSEPYVPGRRSERFWREDELAVLREHYAASGAKACALRLPGRTVRTIYQMAGKLGLVSAAQQRPREWRRIGAAKDAEIRAAWPALKGRGAVQALADRLDVERWWLSQRALKLGLTVPRTKEPAWTAAEDALLARVPLHSPNHAVRIFAEHGFRRTATAIVVRANRLHISRRTHETLSARGVARILGVDDKTVTRWCIDGDLPAGRRETQRLPQQGGDVWTIERAALRRFVVDHLERIDFRKVDRFALVPILVSDEASPATAPRPAPVMPSRELEPPLPSVKPRRAIPAPAIARSAAPPLVPDEALAAPAPKLIERPVRRRVSFVGGRLAERRAARAAKWTPKLARKHRAGRGGKR